MPKTLAKLTPKPLKKPAEWLYNKIWYFGFKYKCPVCESTLRSFKEYCARPNARCPMCGSFARHRFAFIVTKMKTDLFDGSPKKMLHFAPSEAFEKMLRDIPNLDYITTDLDSPDVMVRMDVTDIQSSDNSYDVIYCSHVLEHVPDDNKAMCELRRVVKNDGWVLISVPYKESQKTIEAPSDMSPEERQRLLGAFNHVRLYGNDLKERLVEVGFNVDQIRWSDVLSEEEAERYKIKGQNLFICRRN